MTPLPGFSDERTHFSVLVAAHIYLEDENGNLHAAADLPQRDVKNEFLNGELEQGYIVSDEEGQAWIRWMRSGAPSENIEKVSLEDAPHFSAKGYRLADELPMLGLFRKDGDQVTRIENVMKLRQNEPCLGEIMEAVNTRRQQEAASLGI